MSWLDSLLRKAVKIAGGAPLPERQYWNFVSGATATDNPATGATDITIAVGGTPTGTGLYHVVGGVMVAAAALLVNADVDAAAAIAGSKIAPNFGVQNIIGASLDTSGAATLQLGTSNATTVAIGVVGRYTNILGNASVAGSLDLGASPAGVGRIRVPYNGGTAVPIIAQKNSIGNDVPVLISVGDSFISLGDSTNWSSVQLFGVSAVYSNAPITAFYNAAGSVEYARITCAAATGLLFGATATSVAITQSAAGNVVAANTTITAQNAVGGASVGGDLKVGGGAGNTNGYLDIQNQVLGTGGATVAGGILLTGLFAKTVPIKVNGGIAYVLCLT